MTSEIANTVINNCNNIGYERQNTLESEVLQAGSSLPPILVGHLRTMSIKNPQVLPSIVILEDDKQETEDTAPYHRNKSVSRVSPVSSALQILNAQTI